MTPPPARVPGGFRHTDGRHSNAGGRGAMPEKATVACRDCGRGFVPYRRGVQKYCTPCRDRAAGEAARVLRIRCKECGKPFATANRSVRYCSGTCKKAGYGRVRAANRKRPLRRLEGTSDCRVCGRTFEIGIGHGKRRVYCSDACGAEGRKTRNREDMRKYLADPKRRAIQRARTKVAVDRRRAAEGEHQRRKRGR